MSNHATMVMELGIALGIGGVLAYFLSRKFYSREKQDKEEDLKIDLRKILIDRLHEINEFSDRLPNVSNVGELYGEVDTFKKNCFREFQKNSTLFHKLGLTDEYYNLETEFYTLFFSYSDVDYKNSKEEMIPLASVVANHFDKILKKL